MKNKIFNVVQQGMPYFFILMFTCLLLYSQLAFKAVFWTQYGDTTFHFSRFYDAAQQIKNGNFSYFLMNYSFNQSGRIVNALYGPFFAYFNGLLILIFHTWFRYQIATVFIINLLAGIGFYQLAKQSKVNESVAMISSLMFLTIGFLPLWDSGNNLMAWGAALMPYVIKQGIKMLQNPDKSISPVGLAVTMSIVAQVHLLTLMLAIICLIPFAIIGFIKSSNRLDFVKKILLAMGIALLLTANIWGALLAIFKDNLIAKPVAADLTLTTLKANITGSNMRNAITIGFIAIIVLQCLYIIFHFKQSLENTTITTEGLFFLLCSTSLLPWGKLQAHFPALQSSFQFPFRFTVIAYPLLLLGISITANNLLKQHIVPELVYGLLLLALCESFTPIAVSNFQSSQQYNNQQAGQGAVMHAFWKRWESDVHDHDMGRVFNYLNVLNQDYLPIKKSARNNPRLYNSVNQDLVIRSKHFKKQVIKKDHLLLTWTAKQAGKQKLPIVLYHGSKLTVNHKSAKISSLSNINAPTIEEKKGKNLAELAFISPSWFNVLLIISILSWAALVIFDLIRYVLSAKPEAK